MNGVLVGHKYPSGEPIYRTPCNIELRDEAPALRPSHWSMWWARLWSWTLHVNARENKVCIMRGEQTQSAFAFSELPAAMSSIRRTLFGDPWLSPCGYLVAAQWVPGLRGQLEAINRAWQLRERRT